MGTQDLYRINGTTLLVGKNHWTELLIEQFRRETLLDFLDVRFDMKASLVDCVFEETETDFIFRIDLEEDELEDVDLEKLMADLKEDISALLTPPLVGKYASYFLIALDVELPVFRLLRIPCASKDRKAAISKAWGKLSAHLTRKKLTNFAEEVSLLFTRVPKEKYELFQEFLHHTEN